MWFPLGSPTWCVLCLRDAASSPSVFSCANWQWLNSRTGQRLLTLITTSTPPLRFSLGALGSGHPREWIFQNPLQSTYYREQWLKRQSFIWVFTDCLPDTLLGHQFSDMESLGVLMRVVQRHRSNRMYICRERFMLRDWLTRSWRLASLKFEGKAGVPQRSWCYSRESQGIWKQNAVFLSLVEGEGDGRDLSLFS